MGTAKSILPSPIQVAGALIRAVPRPLFALPLSLAFEVMRKRHASVFDRLSSLGERSFLIDPEDLPLTFMMRPAGKRPTLRLGHARDRLRADATISGPMTVLIDLLEGRIDGDAMFFSRDLTIEGDTDAVLTLRNAIDSDEVDVINDLLTLLGPLARPARAALRQVRRSIASALPPPAVA